MNSAEPNHVRLTEGILPPSRSSRTPWSGHRKVEAIIEDAKRYAELFLTPAGFSSEGGCVNVVSLNPSSSQSFEPLLGQVRPTGWLRRQLEIQAGGLAAISTVLARHRRQCLDRRPDRLGSVAWLDGVVPLAFLLVQRKGRCGGGLHPDVSATTAGWATPQRSGGQSAVRSLAAVHRPQGVDAVREPPETRVVPR